MVHTFRRPTTSRGLGGAAETYVYTATVVAR
jgi:hypothetical protein